MRTVGILSSLLMVVALAACNGGDVNLDGNNNGGGDNNGNSSSECPPPAKWQCVGHGPDKGMVCTCEGLWDCSKDPNKCAGGRPTPPGGGDWKCTWESEYKYVCKKTGKKDAPPGGTNWFCKYNDSEGQWECTKVKTPNPPGSGIWKCVVDDITKKINCTKVGDKTPPVGGGTWDCKTVGGEEVCTKKGGTGLPPGGGDWKCNKTTINGVPTWVCYGKNPKGSAPPGGNGWKCVKVGSEGNYDVYKCQKPESKDDYPGGGWYSCAKGTEFNGTKCTKVPTRPQPPTPTPKKGQKCIPGTKMWCDGLQYCGWGQVDCLPSGKWKTKWLNGKEVLDCQELSNGLRPNTVCACFHFFYNPACCERPDCIVPKGSKGQICPKSAGQLCDYCNPLKPECKSAGAKCIVTNTHETFCGKLCASNASCPVGYQCMTVKLKVGSTKQCIPADYSCYY